MASKPLYELTFAVVESLYITSSKMTLPPENGRTLPLDFKRRRSALLFLVLVNRLFIRLLRVQFRAEETISSLDNASW